MARSLAFQTLFELESRPVSLDTVLAHRLEALQEEAGRPMDARSTAFASQLVEGVLAHRTAIDDEIARVAPAFPVDQMPTTDRVALELGVFELLHQHDVPVKVAINEAVELAKTYGGENSGRFVNGVLGTIAENMTGSGADRPPDTGATTAGDIPTETSRR